MRGQTSSELSLSASRQILQKELNIFSLLPWSVLNREKEAD